MFIPGIDLISLTITSFAASCCSAWCLLSCKWGGGVPVTNNLDINDGINDRIKDGIQDALLDNEPEVGRTPLRVTFRDPLITSICSYDDESGEFVRIAL